MDIAKKIKHHQMLTNVGVLIGLILTWGPTYFIEINEPPGVELWVLIGLRLTGVVCLFGVVVTTR